MLVRVLLDTKPCKNDSGIHVHHSVQANQEITRSRAGQAGEKCPSRAPVTDTKVGKFAPDLRLTPKSKKPCGGEGCISISHAGGGRGSGCVRAWLPFGSRSGLASRSPHRASSSLPPPPPAPASRASFPSACLPVGRSVGVRPPVGGSRRAPPRPRSPIHATAVMYHLVETQSQLRGDAIFPCPLCHRSADDLVH